MQAGVLPISSEVRQGTAPSGAWRLNLLAAEHYASSTLSTCLAEVTADSLKAQGNSACVSPRACAKKSVCSCTREASKQACGAAAPAMRKADLAPAQNRDMAADRECLETGSSAAANRACWPLFRRMRFRLSRC